MKSAAPIMRCESAEQPEMDVVVRARDVGVAMVGDAVFVTPEVRAPAKQIQTEGHPAVDGGRQRIGPMAALVHDIESHAGHGARERGRSQYGQPRLADDEHQQPIRSGQPGSEHGRLQPQGIRTLAGNAATLEEGRRSLRQNRSKSLRFCEYRTLWGKYQRRFPIAASCLEPFTGGAYVNRRLIEPAGWAW